MAAAAISSGMTSLPGECRCGSWRRRALIIGLHSRLQTMNDGRMVLIGLVENQADGAIARELLAFARGVSGWWRRSLLRTEAAGASRFGAMRSNLLTAAGNSAAGLHAGSFGLPGRKAQMIVCSWHDPKPDILTCTASGKHHFRRPKVGEQRS